MALTISIDIRRTNLKRHQSLQTQDLKVLENQLRSLLDAHAAYKNRDVWCPCFQKHYFERGVEVQRRVLIIIVLMVLMLVLALALVHVSVQ